MGKILAGKASDIPSGKMIKVEADGKDILVTNVDGNYYAMDDTCAHAGASLLTEIVSCEKCKDWHENLNLKAEKYGKNFPLTKNPFKKWHVNCRCSCHKS